MAYDVIFFVDSTVSTWRMRSYGVHRLATELRSNGYTVKIVDWACKILNNYRLTTRLLDKLIGDNTLFVGFSGTHFTKHNITEKTFDHYDNFYDDQGRSLYHYPCDDKKFELILDYIHGKNSKIKTVYGGGWAHSSVKLTDKLDYVIYGLADATTIELVNHLKHGTPIKFMPGVSPKQKIINHDELGLSFDFPNSLTKYLPEDHITPGQALCLETSRGCMFKCKFCSFVLLGRKHTDPKYHKEVSVLAQELRNNWDSHKINRYYIIDDTFNESTEKLQDVYAAIQQSGVPDIKFFAYMRLDLLKKYPEQIPLLRDMGLQVAFLGIESLNDETLKLIGKPMKSAEIKQTLEDLKQQWHGKINIHGSFVFGLPKDSPEVIDQWMSWVADPECPLDSVVLHTLVLNPAWPTVFGENMEKYGYSFDDIDKLGYRHWRIGDYARADFRRLQFKYEKSMFYSRRARVGGWEIMGLQNQQRTFEWLYRKPRLDCNRLEILRELKLEYDNYITELCAYEGITP